MENKSKEKIKQISHKKLYNYLAVIIIFSLVGFMVGFAEGVNYAFEKGIQAVEVFFDIELKGKAKNMVRGLPEIMSRIDYETRVKLGLNDTDYLTEMNKTLTELEKMRYSKFNVSLVGGGTE